MSSSAPSSNSTPAVPPEQNIRMGFFDHLEELRRRLLYCVIALVVMAIVCMGMAEHLFAWLQQPMMHLPHQKMIVLTPLELFITYLKLAALAALFTTAPFVLWQIWQFIAPGLYAHEKRWIIPFVGLGSLFFLGGGAFAFYIVLPMGFDYLVGMLPASIEAHYSVAAYFSLVIHMILAFGLVFELPLVMWILAAAGIVAPATFAKIRKYWIVAAFVIGGVLTPPDPFTQILMAIPLLAFFEIGIWGGRWLTRHKHAASGAGTSNQKSVTVQVTASSHDVARP